MNEVSPPFEAVATTPDMSTTNRVFIPLELPNADPVPPVLVDTLTSMEVVVLGYYDLPEQTPLSAGRNQFEADAAAELEDLDEPLESAGIPVTTRLVFSKARDKTIDRIALEEDCNVVLTPGQAAAIEQVVVPLRGQENFDRILSFVGKLLMETNASVTLFNTGEESDRQSREELLVAATEQLVGAGVDSDRVSRQLSTDKDASHSIASLGEAFDLLVLGETEPSLRDRIFGTVPAQVTATTEAPAFVVRNTDASEP
jgi:Universal stress protein family.